MIVITDALALAPTADNPLNTPIFGWKNLATAIAATSEDADHPASFLLNSSTALRWQAEEEGSPLGPPAADQYLTAAIETSDPLDYLAIAAHNLGSGQNTVSVEASDGGSPETWTEIITERLLATDEPAIFRWTPTSYAGVRLRIQPSALAEDPTTPFVAVMHVGKLLVMPRGISGDEHMPINLGRRKQVLNNRSETGQFLGRYLLSQSRSTSLSFRYLEDSWYRSTMDPFIDAAGSDTPFFVAWKPQERPRDVGYCWLTGDPDPQWHRPTGTMGVTLQLSGVGV